MRKNELNRLEMYPLPPVTKAKIVVIGEAPNIEELKAGKYFISKGADILHQTMQKLNIDLSDVYETVAVPYLLNPKKKVIADTMMQRRRIIQEIKESEATLVVPLGAMAASLLLGTNVGMKKVLSNILDIPELPGVTIIPNYHPAMLLHNPGVYKEFTTVMTTIASHYFGEALVAGTTKWEWAEPEKIINGSYAKHFARRPAIGVDIETSSLDTKKALIWVMGVATDKNRVVVFSREHFVDYPQEMNNIFASLAKFVWHGGKYDTEVLHWSGYDEARIDEDTMYLHYCKNETAGTHGLGTLATVYLGADEYKSKMNSEFNHIDTEEAYELRKQDLADRVATDADYTLQLYNLFAPEVHNHPDWSRVYKNLLIPGGNFLRKVQTRGAKVDVPYLKTLEIKFEAEIAEILEDVITAATPYWEPEVYRAQTGAKSSSAVFKPTSTKQMAWMVYDKLRLRPTKKLRGKPRATGAEILESIENPPAFILKVLELRKAKKKLSTYVTSYLECKDENDIVHACFNLHITTSGRLSCTEPNLQNVPSKTPEMRRTFIPRAKNRILMEVDYSGAELKVLAWVSQDEALIKAVTTGDLHSEVAESIFGPDFTKWHRGLAKTINFGIAYGRGAKDLAKTFGVSVQEAQSWIDQWALNYPKAWAYLESCETAARNGDTLVTVYGRHRRFGLVHSGNINDLINEAKNFKIQSISSDNCFLSAMEADDKLVDDYDALIINLIHDSILIDCPADAETVKAVSQYMTEVMLAQPIKQYQCNVPFSCDTDLGPNWGDAVPYGSQMGTVDIKYISEGGEVKHKDVDYLEWIRTQGITI